MLGLLLAALLAQAGRPARPVPAKPRVAHEKTYDQLKPSLFTIEVHSGNQDAKSTLGSGYLVSRGGHVVTNYHVIGSYVEDPTRYQLRAKNASGEFQAQLVGFDLVNDLALLRVPVAANAIPLRLARTKPEAGSSVVAFGNPEGLGLSLVEGIFNGYAEKGLVDRMLLSMPLNSGMSGGPILNAAGEVIGTNVAIERESNSLSFGVPASKLQALLEAEPLALEQGLAAETRRQLTALERDTSARLGREFERVAEAVVSVGAARAPRPPSVFECWDDSELHKEERITKSQYSCNLQFAPYVESLGEVAAVSLLVEHFEVGGGPGFGLFGWLESHAQSHNQVAAIDPKNAWFSPPHCAAERVRVGEVTWKVSSCSSAYLEHPGLFDFDLAATSVGDARSVMYLSLQMNGFRLEPFRALARRYLEGVRPAREKR